MAEDSQTLDEILATLTESQLAYVAIRMYVKTDKDAAEALGLSDSTVYNWQNKQDVNTAVRLAKLDGVRVAHEKLKRLTCTAVDKLGAAIDKDEPTLAAILAVLDRVGLPEVKRIEASGRGGGPIEHKITEIIVELPDESLER